MEHSDISQKYHEFIDHNKQSVNTYLANKQYKEYPATICGYDPMNMIRVDELILCHHFIFLRNESGCIKLDGPVLVKLKEDSNSEIVGYY